MKINVYSSKKELDYEVACEIARLIKSNVDGGYPTHILIPAGRTPIGIYRNLVKFYKKKRLDFTDVHFYMLDEILTPHNNYEELLRRELIDRIDIEPDNFHAIRKDICITNDIVDLYKKELIIDDFDQRFDLCLLGIGEDGHFAMITNPTKELEVFTTMWNELPAISVGLNQVLNSTKIILIANTKEKKDAIKRLINSKFYNDPEIPASYLKGHQGFELAITKDLL